MNMNGRLAVVGERFCFEEETHLTVHKTSVFFPGDGFIVYDPHGHLLFRFDSYGPDSGPLDELVLMDAAGKCLLTLSRKKPSLHQRWEGFVGERKEDRGPVFGVHRSSIIGRSSVVVEVFGDKGEEYQIEGSYSQRCCTIYKSLSESTSREPTAEIKRKVDPSTHVMLGRDVFALHLKPGFDSAFAMGLVLILDQMFGDDADVDARDVGPTLEDSSA
ncbi:protein LURP-one-related 5 [Ziziphus jujuba]|uniref:Protein LURP-one-related 5 n=1 Tax=Ziziphus jujuba TaxID=326968 RepID=A0A6P4AFY7_ZIZJJ|nr:protein LURP-one-related 5 [Ziziphus jujuba]